MIGKITGRVDYVAHDHALIEAAGVGYLVFATPATLAGLGGAGAIAALYTELSVREDGWTLYGFPTLAERDWHRLLCSVQGVGAKLALSIIGTLGTTALTRIISLGDTGAMRKVPGVGPKLAARLVLELKDKAPAMLAAPVANAAVLEEPAPVAQPAATPKRAPAVTKTQANHGADALSALVNLGYAPADAAAAVAAVQLDAPEAPLQALIRAALKRLAPEA